MTAIALDITTAAYYAPEERDRDHTSYVISTSTLVFADAEDATDFLVTGKGLSPERAALVLARKCEFQIEDLPEPLRFKVYRFRAA